MRPPVAVLLALAACGGDPGLPVAAECNPLGANACMTPWPSSAFEVADTSTRTGRRLAIPTGTLPRNFQGIHVDPTGWNSADGFSPAAPIVMSFPGGVSVAGLPDPDHIAASLAADSPTVLIDMTTGQRVAHYAEVDAVAEATPDSQALLIRPAARLVGGHRYAVAITSRVHGKGGDLPVPAGFAALRDGKHTGHHLLEAMRPRFADVLAALASAGVPASDLVVAWDFTVASDELLRTDMIAARDRALDALSTHAIQYAIQTDMPIGDGSQIKRRITGTFDAPLLLSDGGAVSAYPVIVRDGAGLPAVQGFYQVPFTAIIPACAYSQTTPVAMVMYGHGLLGDSTETSDDTQATLAADLCVVMVGTDMRGMSQQDTAAVGNVLNEASRADEVFEVLEQGIVNHVALARAMRTTFAQSLFVSAGKTLVDPARVYYYGLSQGGILGTSVMAYEPTITRAVLGVGAANYSMLLDRSADWPKYRTILVGGYPDPLDDVLILSLCQMRWDKTEASGISNVVLAGTPTKVPAKQLLMQIALSDEQVPNVGSFWQARTLGIPVLGPTPAMPWGLSVQQAPLAAGSALVIEDGGAPAAPIVNLPPIVRDPSMHDLTRTQPASRRQIRDFFATGQIVNECAGACACQTGACN